MKNYSTTSLLNFVLALLVILGVIFAMLTMTRTRDLRTINPYAMQAQQKAIMMQTMVNDVSTYNTQVKNPELTRILQTLQPKSAAQ
jgi:hypothetical protein